jgi:tight adherence protein B
MNLLAILAFFVVSFTVAGAVVLAALVWTGRKRAAEANQDEPSALAILKSEELSSIGAWHDLLARFDFIDLLGTRLAQADLNWSVGRVTMAMLLLATIAFAIVWQISWLPIWLALIVVPVAGMAPYIYIASKRKRRFHKFKELFPDALESLARALRSGGTVAGGLDIVAEECDAPVSTEIRKTFVEVNLGMPWERALENLAKRVPLQEVSLFVAAVQIHSRTGGKLGEVMGRLAETMREQNSLQGEVRAIAAHGKLTGIVLTILPLAIAGLMMIVSPDYISMLFTHPWGKHMIAGAGVCLVLAHVIISRIVDIEA